MPLDAEGMAKLRAMRGKGKKKDDFQTIEKEIWSKMTASYEADNNRRIKQQLKNI